MEEEKHREPLSSMRSPRHRRRGSQIERMFKSTELLCPSGDYLQIAPDARVREDVAADSMNDMRYHNRMRIHSRRPPPAFLALLRAQVRLPASAGAPDRRAKRACRAEPARRRSCINAMACDAAPRFVGGHCGGRE